MILVLLLVLTVSQVVSTAIHYSDRADSLTILGGGQVAERIATIARLSIPSGCSAAIRSWI